MLETKIVIGLAVALVVGLILFFGVGDLTGSRWGRIALLLGVAVLPVGMSTATLTVGVNESSKTRFCLQCHEMQDYGKSLFVDNRQALSANLRDRLLAPEVGQELRWTAVGAEH